MDGERAAWFIVLPDCDSASVAVNLITPFSRQRIAHPSGRPWVIGCWPVQNQNLYASGGALVCLLGIHGADTEFVQHALTRAPSLDAMSAMTTSISGCFHLLASMGGEVRAQGSISGTRRLFRSRILGVTLLCDDATILARFSGGQPDRSSLAARLVYPACPSPLDRLSCWTSVSSVPEDAWVRLTRDGQATVEQWWTPPAASHDLDHGAAVLRTALSDAVRCRTQVAENMSADLSGGLDSTPLCFLAAARKPDLTMFTAEVGASVDGDLHWADLAAKHLPGIRRDVVRADDLPLPFSRLAAIDLSMADEPFVAAAVAHRIGFTAARLARLGSQLHLTGHGGDEVLLAPVNFLYEFPWRNPRIGLMRLREYQALHRWNRRALLHRLADRRTYRAWMLAIVDSLDAAPPDPTDPPSVWGTLAVRLPPWATPDAHRELAELLRAQAEETPPSVCDRSQFAAIESIRQAGRTARLIGKIMGFHGLAMCAPFLDDQVVHCCLSVKPEERTSARRFKPLIVKAMGGIVPDEILKRSTKPNFTADVHIGRRRHAGELVALCTRSRLEELGLVDGRLLRDACEGVGASVPPIALWRTLACETWLRAHENDPRRETTTRVQQ